MASANPIIQSKHSTYLTTDTGPHKRRDFHESVVGELLLVHRKTLTDEIFFSEINKLKVEDEESMTGWILHKEYENSGKIKCEVMNFISCHHNVFQRNVSDLVLDALYKLEQSCKHKTYFIEHNTNYFFQVVGYFFKSLNHFFNFNAILTVVFCVFVYGWILFKWLVHYGYR